MGAGVIETFRKINYGGNGSGLMETFRKIIYGGNGSGLYGNVPENNLRRKWEWTLWKRSGK
jgi:hypothetical protein